MRHLDDSFQELSGVSILLPGLFLCNGQVTVKNISINGPGKSFLESTVGNSSDRWSRSRNVILIPIHNVFSIAGLKHDKLVSEDAKSLTCRSRLMEVERSAR